MLNKIRFCLIIVSCVLLAGCSSSIFFENDKAYQQASSIHNLHLPAGYSNTKLESYFAIPYAPGVVGSSKPGLLPPGSLAERLKHDKSLKTAINNDQPVSIFTDAQGNVQLLWQVSMKQAYRLTPKILKSLGYLVPHGNKRLHIIYFVAKPTFISTKKIYQVRMQPISLYNTRLWILSGVGQPLPARVAEWFLHKMAKVMKH